MKKKTKTKRDRELDRACGVADDLFDEISKRVQKSRADKGLIAYSLWISFTHVLAGYGWTPKELARDARLHVRDQRKFLTTPE